MATANTTYEVQGFAGGEWFRLRVCGESEDAIAEAMRARRGRKYLSVRVSAEVYDETTGKYHSRVVYRYSPLTEDRAVAVRRAQQRASREDRGRDNTPFRAPAMELAEPESLTDMLIWRMGLVAIIGVGLWMGVHHFLHLL